MRVLHIDSGREMRGGQWQALRLHRGLVRRGWNSFLLARADSPLLRAARAEALPCDVLTPLRLMGQSRTSDLVHAHDARSHTLAALVARAPVVVSRRVAFPVGESAASRWKYGKADRFIAVSQFVAGQLRAAGVEEARIRVVYDGVPLPHEAAMGFAILIPDTDDPQKGAALAEEAAKLAGVTVKRSVNLEADLPMALALIYLTQSEGLGSGILLAMAYGVTVIASNVGGIPELIRDGENGMLVENNAKAVAVAIKRIDPAMGQAGRETVITRFTEQRMIEGTMKVYDEL